MKKYRVCIKIEGEDEFEIIPWCDLEGNSIDEVSERVRNDSEDTAIIRHGIPAVHYKRLFNSEGKMIQAYPFGYECPFCGDPDIKAFCPTCGAKMDAEQSAKE